MIWKSPTFSLARCCIQLSQGMAQTDAPQPLQCTTNRAILNSFPWQLKAGFNLPYTTARSAGAALLARMQWRAATSHWEAKLPQPFPQLLAEQILHWISLVSWAVTHSHPFAYLLEKEIFLISPAEGARQRLSLQYFASTADGFIILPQRVQASGSCASPEEKNNKQFKTCQHVFKLLTEQLFKPTWVTNKIKLSPHCGTQAE